MRTYNDDDVVSAVQSSVTMAEVCRKLNISGGGSYQTIRSIVKRLGISLDHMKGRGWAKGLVFDRNPKRSLDEILVRDSTYPHTNNLKARLIKEGFLKKKCYECGIVEWRGKPAPLQLDHINGDRLDNRIENLRILCPNCHAQTDTWCGRNKRGIPLRLLSKDIVGRQSIKIKTICCICGEETKNKKYCSRICQGVSIRRVSRPSSAELEKELKASSMRALGRKYGVSDNAIRKWAKQYGLI